MAQRAGVHLTAHTSLSVAVANGTRITSPGRALGQSMRIGREAFNIDLYALLLGEYDMVLGVQWLGTLDPILWDFAKHTMAFKRGKRVLWRGTDTPGFSAAALSGPGDNLMDALLEEFAGLFVEPQGLPPRRHLSHRFRLKRGVGDAVAVALLDSGSSHNYINV